MINHLKYLIDNTNKIISLILPELFFTLIKSFVHNSYVLITNATHNYMPTHLNTYNPAITGINVLDQYISIINECWRVQIMTNPWVFTGIKPCNRESLHQVQRRCIIERYTCVFVVSSND